MEWPKQQAAARTMGDHGGRTQLGAWRCSARADGPRWSVTVLVLASLVADGIPSAPRRRAGPEPGTSASSSTRRTATPTSTRCTTARACRPARSRTSITTWSTRSSSVPSCRRAAWVVRSISNPTSGAAVLRRHSRRTGAVPGGRGARDRLLAGRSRRWTALLVAFSPALILSAFINWDLIAMGLMMMALAAWASRRGVLAGVLLGLAIATKFYPIVVLAGLLPLCLRAGRLRAFCVTAASAAAAWLVVNLPVAIAAPDGWSRSTHSTAAGAPTGAGSGTSSSTCTGQSSARRRGRAQPGRPAAFVVAFSRSGCSYWPPRGGRDWRS